MTALAEDSKITTTEKTETSAKNLLTVICFSKDRPFQVRKVGKRGKMYCNCKLEVGDNKKQTNKRNGERRNDTANEGKYVYKVLYTFSEAKYEKCYEKIKAAFPKIEFVVEREKKFASDLLSLLSNVKTPYVCFHVDDMFFYRSLDLDSICKMLDDDNSKIFAFFPKLNSQINFCHPANEKAPTPTFFRKPIYPGLLSWMPRMCVSDWCYLFDLCGTIYRTGYSNEIWHNGFVQVIHLFLNFIFVCLTGPLIIVLMNCGKQSPNRFEVHGNNCVDQIYPGKHMRLFAGCVEDSVMSVITINRVQKDYNVPIYSEQELSTEKLLEFFEKDYELDWSKYADQTFNSVHIGHCFFCHDKRNLAFGSNTKSDDVSQQKTD
ncbi:bifunctional glycosyltransferase [Reticulomyxa filosa]|uniref:Bifunctional glycosyltransferase n=1 Tax=Reticulomyxa filosa TaxID=46433 RepID=X6MU82_RETFI|nr:bifunctional glycosyltransferase [Reticulomyxa filosa]|eukprot:ETO17543.1 bifunctional glycosyltransferase [Reticulomyxa filosa]